MKIWTMLAVGAAVLALSPRHRARVRRFVSWRLVDREARDALEHELEEERWDNDGGAGGATTEETVG